MWLNEPRKRQDKHELGKGLSTLSFFAFPRQFQGDFPGSFPLIVVTYNKPARDGIEEACHSDLTGIYEIIALGPCGWSMVLLGRIRKPEEGKIELQVIKSFCEHKYFSAMRQYTTSAVT